VTAGNTLADRFPTLAAELDPALNDGWTPDLITTGSNRKANWRCSADPTHIWQARINSRTTGGRGCPQCFQVRRRQEETAPGKTLADRFPNLAAELDAALNNGLTADRIAAGSDRKVAWRCATNPEHTWQATVHSRTTGRGCPQCSRERPRGPRNLRWPTGTTLADRNPTIAAELDPILNDGLTADQVSQASPTRITWRCRTNTTHTWTAAPASRITHGTGCPHCSIARRKLPKPGRSLAERYPDLTAELDPTLNSGLTADRITATCDDRLTWRCRANPEHTWQMSVIWRTNPACRGCPACFSLTRPADTTA